MRHEVRHGSDVAPGGLGWLAERIDDLHGGDALPGAGSRRGSEDLASCQQRVSADQPGPRGLPRVVLIVVGESGDQFVRRQVRADRFGQVRVHLLHSPATERHYLQLRAVSRGGTELDEHVGYRRKGITVFVAIDAGERINDIRNLEGERVAMSLAQRLAARATEANGRLKYWREEQRSRQAGEGEPPPGTLASRSPDGWPGWPAVASVCSDQKLRDFLLAQSPMWLTERLLNAAAGDRVLLAGLQAAAAGSDGVQVVRRELDRAIWVNEYVEWDESATYVFGVNRALELLADLVRDGYPDQAIELAEHAMDLLEQAVERVQDDGDTHGCLVWAQEIHVRACAAGNPDPMALAQRLFTRATADEWGVFVNIVADYTDVLGPAGVATLRGLITEKLQRLPRLVAGASADVHHSTILGLAEQAAKADGVDAIVDVLARDLRSASRFERICQELMAAGRVEQALEWARRGLAEFHGRIDHGLPDLRRLTASLHAQMGRHGEAVELAWHDFAVVPSVEGYQRLREYGESDGSWARWRERALDELRKQPPLATPPPPTKEWPGPRGHSVLVNVLLEEGDVQAAWEAAHDGGCLEGVWLTLARKRAQQHPRDAIPVFCRQVEAAVEIAKRDGYEHAVSLLTEVSGCYARVGASAEFADHVRSLRAAHRRKRNFIAALDAARLPA